MFTGHPIRCFQCCAGKHGRRDVDVGDDLLDHARFEKRRTSYEQGNAHRLFIGGTFVDQAMLAEHEAIVAHLDD